MSYPTTPDGEATPADKAVEIHDRFMREDDISFADMEWLYGEIKALREDLAGYETVFNLAQKREHPWIEAWRKATSKPDTLPDYGEMLGWLCGQIEAAEAREAGLAGALEKIACSGPVDMEGNDDPEAGWSWCYDVAKAALAATPARVTERAKAVEELKLSAREILDSCFPIKETGGYAEPSGHTVRNLKGALNVLDALGKE